MQRNTNFYLTKKLECSQLVAKEDTITAFYRAPYTLYKRRMKNSKYVYYYRIYLPNGLRSGGHSTGCTSKNAARFFCDELLRKGLLGEVSQNFSQYAQGFFDYTAPWVKNRLAEGTEEHPALSDSYIAKMQGILKRHLIPYFNKKKLQEITPSLIRNFRTVLIQEKNLSLKTVNNIADCLRIILSTAYNDGIILLDPFRGIRSLVSTNKNRGTFTIAEAQKIFAGQWESEETKLANITAALTGLRISEVLAIRNKNLHEKYIDVIDQRYHGKLIPPKTKQSRKVPIPDFLYKELKQRIDKSGEFAFYENNFFQPYFHLRKVIEDIGLEKEREKRNLCFHSWRHFFNTFLLAGNVPPIKVAAVLGHSTGSGTMQERYTNWRPEMFPEVYKAQENLLNKLLM